jgi:hypothetical protein
MAFSSDYPGAIVVEAKNYGYGAHVNAPRGFCFHCPEETADDDPQTPRYLAGTTRLASYHYFVSYLGFVFQLVPEREGAYANYVTGKPYPSWANSAVNLNLQTISVSFEGFAHNIHLTMKRGGPQWKAGVALVAHRSEALGVTNWTRHKDVSSQRSDPGQLDMALFMRDVEDAMSKAQVARYLRDVEQKMAAGQQLAGDDKELWAWFEALTLRTGRDQDWGKHLTVTEVSAAIAGHNDNQPHGGTGGLKDGDVVELKKR